MQHQQNPAVDQRIAQIKSLKLSPPWRVSLMAPLFLWLRLRQNSGAEVKKY